MAKNILLKELILIDLKNDKYGFYNVEVISLAYNELQVVFHHGKLGTKGTKNIKNTNSYEEAMALAYKKFYEQRAKNYREKEDLMGWLGQLNTTSKDNDKTLKMKKKKTNSKNQNISNSNRYCCDICKKSIKKEIYDEIDKWGRSGGGWDKDKSFIAYKKVLCIDCQWKHDIFKKRL